MILWCKKSSFSKVSSDIELLIGVIVCEAVAKSRSDSIESIGAEWFLVDVAWHDLNKLLLFFTKTKENFPFFHKKWLKLSIFLQNSSFFHKNRQFLSIFSLKRNIFQKIFIEKNHIRGPYDFHQILDKNFKNIRDPYDFGPSRNGILASPMFKHYLNVSTTTINQLFMLDSELDHQRLSFVWEWREFGGDRIEFSVLRSLETLVTFGITIEFSMGQFPLTKIIFMFWDNPSILPGIVKKFFLEVNFT